MITQAQAMPELQSNFKTGKVYQGKYNQKFLMMAKMKEGYKSDSWVTFLQARELGYKLVNAKGKGISVFRGYSSYSEVLKDEDGKIKVKNGSRSNGYSKVFNMDLCQKLTKEEIAKYKNYKKSNKANL